MGKRGFGSTIWRLALVLSLAVTGSVAGSAARADDLPLSNTTPLAHVILLCPALRRDRQTASRRGRRRCSVAIGSTEQSAASWTP